MLVGDYPSSEMHYLLEIVLQAARALRLVSTHTHVLPLNTLSRGPRESWLVSPLDEQRRAREAFHTLFHGREHPVGKSSPSIVPRHTRINVPMVHGACLCSRYLQSAQSDQPGGAPLRNYDAERSSVRTRYAPGRSPGPTTQDQYPEWKRIIWKK